MYPRCTSSSLLLLRSAALARLSQSALPAPLAPLAQLRRAGRSTSTLCAPHEAIEAARALIARSQPGARCGGAATWSHLEHVDLINDEYDAVAKPLDDAAEGGPRFETGAGLHAGVAAADGAAVMAAAGARDDDRTPKPPLDWPHAHPEVRYEVGRAPAAIARTHLHPTASATDRSRHPRAGAQRPRQAED